MKQDPEKFAETMNLLKDRGFYPNFRPSEVSGTPEQIARAAVNHMKANMRLIYEQAHALDADKLWYDGARRIVDRQAKKYGLEDMSVAGVYAALSPQKDWNANVYLGDRLIAIHHGEQKTKWNAKMDATANKIWKKENKAIADAIRGKTLGELKTATEKAIWIRTFDEAHSDRTYQSVSSTGELGEKVRNKPRSKKETVGPEAKAAWQSTPAIASAIQSLESKGNRDIISEAMGEQHKVRSFYNNILDPHSANGDVTSDTHHVGVALLRDLGGSAVPVAHNFGNSIEKADQAKVVSEAKRLSGGTAEPEWRAAGSSSVTGLSGTYALYGDATRELAKELNIQPRQLQSVIWTTKRTLFAGAGDAEHDAIERAWHSYNRGETDLKTTQGNVLKILKEGAPLGEGLLSRLQKEGGFTYNTTAKTSPKEGYVVSPYKPRERIIDVKDLKPTDFAQYAIDNADLLNKKGHSLGAWHNTDDGKIYLDVVVVEKKEAAAIKLSQDNDQISYYDIKKKEVVDTPGRKKK